ncbi:MAG: Hpt domain-containing protein [Arthrobacter sp.]
MNPAPSEGDHLPVLDLQYISDWGADLGEAAARDFLATYLELLPARLAGITSAVLAEDSDAAMERLISLKVTSAMVGALRLSALARDLELMVRAAAWRSARVVLTPLAEETAAVQGEGSEAGY